MSWTLVTGAAKRLGAEICHTLARAGRNVVVHYNTSEREAEAVVAQCRSEGVEADMIAGDFSSAASTLDFLVRYLREFGDTAYLVNNVGNYPTMSALETSLDGWSELFQVNFNAPLAITAALASSIRQRRGSIVNIGVAGLEGRRAFRKAPFMTTKVSLLALTRSLALEVAGDGVSVNMVSPGQLDISVDDRTKTVPMARQGTCREVAEVVAFLLEEKNRYITGQNIEVDGGLALR